ncbi:hypothetical protein ABDZ15_19865, partial [Mycobacterium canetti]
MLTQVYEPAFLVALLTTIRTASNLARRRYGPWNGPRRSRAIQHSAATIRAVERPEEKPRNPAQRGDDTGRGTARGEAAQS